MLSTTNHWFVTVQHASHVWKALCSALGAQVSLSSTFHPQIQHRRTQRINLEPWTTVVWITCPWRKMFSPGHKRHVYSHEPWISVRGYVGSVFGGPRCGHRRADGINSNKRRAFISAGIRGTLIKAKKNRLWNYYLKLN